MPTFYDAFHQYPHYAEDLMRDKLGIGCTDDFGKRHGQWLDELAEANDELGTMVGWCFTKATVKGKPPQDDFVRIPVIEIIFDHGIITVNYELTLLSKRTIQRIDEQ